MAQRRVTPAIQPVQPQPPLPAAGAAAAMVNAPPGISLRRSLAMFALCVVLRLPRFGLQMASNYNYVGDVGFGPRFRQLAQETLLYQHAFRLLFTWAVLLYTCAYDRCTSNYISLVYQHDKYGVALMYAVVALVMVYTDMMWIDLRYVGSEPRLDQIWQIISKARAKFMLTLVTAIKVIVFTLIFKNHLSTSRLQTWIHRTMVILLAVASVAAMAVRWFFCNELMFGMWPVETVIEWAVEGALWFALFRGTGMLQEKGWWPKEPWLNVLVVIAESLLIEQSF